ncbi:DIG-like 4 [Hibiscus trionum]|uniref:DIG-like 4 n=1 Tax=Hibiscus trionum TaxID=183268 RepID=A0A9W7J9L8_HIBTR|nr:DIG-like 4 [Hibiscus trionum]
MQGGDYWSMLKCSGGAHDKTITNQIMLRFRPIAPKPVTGDSSSGGSPFNSKNLVVTSKRTKRKYVRVCEKNNSSMKKRILDEAKEDNDENKGFVTLQLMPEKADLRESIVVERSCVVDDDDPDRALGLNNRSNYRFQDPPSLCLTLNMVAADHAEGMGLSMTDPDRRSRRMTVVESSLMVESVTEACIDVGEMVNLEKDTCPGFVSDGLNRVLWVNQAYKNMVGLGEGGGGAETAVGLVVKDGFVFPRGAFSCRVRLRYVDGMGKNWSKTVPCDVWRLSSDGLAWRLDANAALSLGL